LQKPLPRCRNKIRSGQVKKHEREEGGKEKLEVTDVMGEKIGKEQGEIQEGGGECRGVCFKKSESKREVEKKEGGGEPGKGKDQGGRGKPTRQARRPGHARPSRQPPTTAVKKDEEEASQGHTDGNRIHGKRGKKETPVTKSPFICIRKCFLKKIATLDWQVRAMSTMAQSVFKRRKRNNEKNNTARSPKRS